MCALCRPWEGLVIGIIGGAIAVYTPPILERMKIDDPVGVVGVHCISAYWGLLSVGLFAQPDNIEGITTMSGLFYGGGFKLLGIQLYMAVVMTVWTLTLAFLMLYVIEKTIGLRCSEEHEILGADLCEHGIIQLSLAEKLEMTKELIKSGYQSPFMDELRAAAIQPDFLKHSVRRSSRMSLVIPTISNNVKSVNGDLNIHDNTLRDGSVSIDIENNWNLKSSPLIHRGENGRSSVTSNGWSPSMTPQAEGNGHCSGKENAAFDHNELEDAKKVENTDNISSKNHQVVI